MTVDATRRRAPGRRRSRVRGGGEGGVLLPGQDVVQRRQQVVDRLRLDGEGAAVPVALLGQQAGVPEHPHVVSHTVNRRGPLGAGLIASQPSGVICLFGSSTVGGVRLRPATA